KLHRISRTLLEGAVVDEKKNSSPEEPTDKTKCVINSSDYERDAANKSPNLLCKHDQSPHLSPIPSPRNRTSSSPTPIREYFSSSPTSLTLPDSVRLSHQTPTNLTRPHTEITTRPVSLHLNTIPTSPALALRNTRRGSEPLLDVYSKNAEKITTPDKKWEKLRSILVVMKNETVDVDQIINSSPSDLLSSLKEKITIQEELVTLQLKLTSLQDTIKQMDIDLQQLKSERDSALACIRQMQSETFQPTPNTELDRIADYYERGIEGLKAHDVSKDDVLEALMYMLKEFKSQRSYLDRLMMVVLMRAPWMLDEVDKTELLVDDNNNDDSDSVYNDSDGEVWC
ncbi:uncharacterized protein LOC131931554, partial [Physella acuta]|uniref:uncharacterized protein LOC131931554 n=1 Tax=Physella acuta TaxID=109671 RepID=UPI0027DD81E0